MWLSASLLFDTLTPQMMAISRQGGREEGRRREYRRVPQQLTHDVDVYDLDAQQTVTLGGRHEVVWGGGVRVNQGQYNEAAALFAANETSLRDAGDESWLGHARFHLGVIAWAQGDEARARSLLRDIVDHVERPSPN